MGKQAKHAYLEAIRGRYLKANRAGKAQILDEFCAVCGYHRKYAIRLLRCKKAASEAPRHQSTINEQSMGSDSIVLAIGIR